MNIQYEIISFHPTTGSLLVRYFSAEVPNGLTYNIDIPLENGAFITQDKINELIMAMAPVGQLERIAALSTIDIPQELKALVPPEPVVTDVPQIM